MYIPVMKCGRIISHDLDRSVSILFWNDADSCEATARLIARAANSCDLEERSADPDVISCDPDVISRDPGEISRDPGEISRDPGEISRDSDELSRDCEVCGRQLDGEVVVLVTSVCSA